MATAEDILSLIRTRGTRVTREIIVQRLLALADRYVPRFKNVILAAFRMGRGGMSGEDLIRKLAAAIQTRDVAAVEAVVPWQSTAVPALEVTVPTMVRDLTVTAARVAERLLPGNLTYRFDVNNPLAVKAALDHGAELVTQVSEETQQAIRNVIARAIQEGRPPLVAARQIRDTVGLTVRQEQAIATMGEKGASERTLRIARGRMLRERTELIARTETLRATNEGQTALWKQAADAGVIQHTARREFIVTPDDRLCPVCEPLDKKQYGIGEQIVTEFGAVDSPPIHPQCRCTLALVVS